MRNSYFSYRNADWGFYFNGNPDSTDCGITIINVDRLDHGEWSWGNAVDQGSVDVTVQGENIGFGTSGFEVVSGLTTHSSFLVEPELVELGGSDTLEWEYKKDEAVDVDCFVIGVQPEPTEVVLEGGS